MNEQTYYVYLLIDPRDGEVFYVGVSCQPYLRLKQHKSDRGSAAYADLFEMRVSKVTPLISIVGQHRNRSEAEAHERGLIAFLPYTKNRDRRAA